MKQALKWALFFIMVSSTTFAVQLDEAGFQLGKKLMSRGNYASAVEEFEAIIKEHPDSAYYESSLFFSAKCWQSLKRYPKATLRYGQVLIFSRDEVRLRQALFGLAMSRYKNRDWRLAAEQFEKFATLYPNSPVAPAALYYGFKAFKEVRDENYAEKLKELLIQNYPEHRYARRLASVGDRDESFSSSSVQNKRDKRDKRDKIVQDGLDKNNTNPLIQENAEIGGQEKPKSHFGHNDVMPLPDLKEENKVQNESDQKKVVGDSQTAHNPVKTNVITLVLTNSVTNEVWKEVTNLPSTTNSFIIKKTNAVHLILSNEVVTFMTNEYNITNQVMITNVWTDYKTNRIQVLTNEVIHEVKVIDTNWLKQKEMSEEEKVKQEEIERLRRLVELKARLLELKQKMIEKKEGLVLTN